MAAKKADEKNKKKTSTSTAKKTGSTKNSAKKSSVKKSAHPKPKASARKSKTASKSNSKAASAKKSNSKKATAKKPVNQSKTNKKTSAKSSKKSSSQKKTSAKSSAKKSSQNTARGKPISKKPSNKKPVAAKPGNAKQAVKQSSKSSSNRSKPAKSPQFPIMRWGPESVLSFEATSQLPPPELTSIAGGFVFFNDKLILANIPGRGWEIIGGRIDVGERPEDTFRREAQNQIGVELEHVQMIGVVRIEHKGPEPPNCPYPFPVGYGVQFIGIAKEMRSFGGSNDSLGRSSITPEGFKEHYYDWNEYYDAIFRYAYESYQKLKMKLND